MDDLAREIERIAQLTDEQRQSELTALYLDWGEVKDQEKTLTDERKSIERRMQSHLAFLPGEKFNLDGVFSAGIKTSHTRWSWNDEELQAIMQQLEADPFRQLTAGTVLQWLRDARKQTMVSGSFYCTPSKKNGNGST